MCARGVTFRKRAHSIGVSVNETTSETRIATATVTPKLLKKRPTCPSMNATGRKITTSEKRRRQHREADLAGRLARRLAGADALLLHVAEDVLEHDDRVVDDDADGQDQRRAW